GDWSSDVCSSDLATFGALPVYRRRRPGGRELLEGRDGLEGAQEHGCWSRRARHPDLAFPTRFPRTKRLHHESYQYRSTQDGFIREIRLAARVVSAHRFFIAGIEAQSRCDRKRTESRA